MDLKNLAIIILAAGSSSRMGRSKQLIIIDRQPMLVKAIEESMLTGINEIVVVLGSNESQHRKAVEKFPVQIVCNREWANGMGSSLKSGLKHLIENKTLNGVIILVCDQPTVTAEVIVSLVKKHKETGKSIIASKYADTTGVPVFFGSTYFEHLLGLKDEHGAKKIVTEHMNEVATVDFPSGEIDLDTPEDLNIFFKNN
jgi:molybdenum cofactor cytidylyltransferase